MSDVDLSAFAVEVREFGAFSGVGYDHEMPVLPIRPRGSLLSYAYALLYHLTLYGSRKVQALTNRPRRSEQFVR